MIKFYSLNFLNIPILLELHAIMQMSLVKSIVKVKFSDKNTTKQLGLIINNIIVFCSVSFSIIICIWLLFYVCTTSVLITMCHCDCCVI